MIATYYCPVTGCGKRLPCWHAPPIPWPMPSASPFTIPSEILRQVRAIAIAVRAKTRVRP